MKILVILFLILYCCNTLVNISAKSTSSALYKHQKYVYGVLNGIQETELIPLYNGSFRMMNKLEIIKESLQFLKEENSNNYDDTSGILFKLFTKLNPNSGQLIKTNDKNSLSHSNFNANNPTRIVVHGWQSSEKAKINELIRKAYLQKGSYNVIIMDWSSIASSVNYVKVRNKVDIVGKSLEQFCNFLHSAGNMQFKNLYLIGHSLGAHVVGHAGKFLTKQKINTIIGLDPAGPLFSVNEPQKRLANTDAEYVETIHTDSTKYGIPDPIGQASFYPNEGKNQPGCINVVDVAGCSHSKSYEYFAESIQNNKFIPKDCDDVKKFNRDFHSRLGTQCGKNIKNIKMGGEPVLKKSKGIYYLRTNSKSPFGLG